MGSQVAFAARLTCFSSSNAGPRMTSRFLQRAPALRSYETNVVIRVELILVRMALSDTLAKYPIYRDDNILHVSSSR